MAVAFQSVGAVSEVASNANTAFTPALPATRPTGSVVLCIAWTRLITATLTTPTGWTLLSGFPKTSATASGGRLWVFARAVDATLTAGPSLAFTGPVTGNTGDEAAGVCICYSGVDISGTNLANLLDVTVPAPTDAAGTTTCTYPAITTATNGAMVVRTLCRFQDLAVTFTPTASPAHTERVDFSSTNRTGGQQHLQEMIAATAGVQAAVTVTPSSTTSSRYLAVSLALKPATVPGAPTIGTATGGNAQASVAFTPPASNGGAPITSYRVTSSPGGITATGSASPVTITGLTNGTAYTFTVAAQNSVGFSAESAASNSVTPVAPPPKTIAAATTELDDPAGTPATRTLHKIVVRAKKGNAAHTATVRAQLFEGATARSAVLETTNLTTSPADYSLSVADADAAAIGNYNNLQPAVTGYSSAGDAAQIQIYEVWVEIPAPSGVSSTNLSPSSITTGEAFGSATVSPGAVNVAPSSITTAEAFGSTTVTPPPSTISTTGIGSAEAFGSAVVQPGATSITVTGIGSAEAFGTSTVTRGAVSIAPSSIGSAESFGSTSLQPGSVSVSPTGIGSAEAFGSTSVAPGAVSIASGSIGSAEAFGNALLTSVATISTTGIGSAEAFGSQTIQSGASSIAPAGISSSEAFGSQNVQVGAVSIAPTGISSAEAFGSTQVSPGAVSLSVSSIASAESFGTSQITRGPVSISASGITSSEAFGTSNLSGAIFAGRLPTSSRLPTGTLLPGGGAQLTTSSIPSSESFGSSLVAQTVSLSPGGIASAETWGASTVQRGAASTTPSSIPSAESWGTAFLSRGAVLVTAQPISSAEAFGVAQLLDFVRTYDRLEIEVDERPYVLHVATTPFSVAVGEVNARRSVVVDEDVNRLLAVAVAPYTVEVELDLNRRVLSPQVSGRGVHITESPSRKVEVVE